jgi:hypothetical protein
MVLLIGGGMLMGEHLVRSARAELKSLEADVFFNSLLGCKTVTTGNFMSMLSWHVPFA